MLFLITGTDSEKARTKLNVLIEKDSNDTTIRITDAHTIADLEAALAGGGMFGGVRSIVLDGVLAHDEMREVLVRSLPVLKAAADTFYIYESAPDAATRKLLEKYAQSSDRYDAAKAVRQETIFGLVRAFQAGKKKDLWVGYQRELIAGKAPEAVHGILFYAAKDALLKNPRDTRARTAVAQLAELPHEARRAGFDLEYALEYYVLSMV